MNLREIVSASKKRRDRRIELPVSNSPEALASPLDAEPESADDLARYLAKASTVGLTGVVDLTRQDRPQLHTVRKGDSLTSIAEHHYQDSDKAAFIASTNLLLPTDALFIGQILTIPG